jgi:anti-anti-sigma factor
MPMQHVPSVEVLMEPLIAPTRLVSDQRLEFRRLVLEHLEACAQSESRTVDVDLGATLEMDASGLGVLVLLQKRAKERGLRTRLLRASRPLFETLRLTRLDALFEFPTAS